VHDFATRRTDSVTWGTRGRVPITESIKMEFNESMRELNPDLTEQFLASITASVERADSMPLFRSVLVGPDDNFWIDETPVPADTVTDWGVRTPDGIAIGRARLPAFQVLQVGDEFVLGICYDENRVPHVAPLRADARALKPGPDTRHCSLRAQHVSRRPTSRTQCRHQHRCIRPGQPASLPRRRTGRCGRTENVREPGVEHEGEGDKA
jgi:hypothetical protein